MATDVIKGVEQQILSWPDVEVEAGPGPFSDRMSLFKLGKREIGHIHYEGVAHLPFPRQVREELVETGQAVPHSAGFRSHIEVAVQTAEDIEPAVELFRKSYDRAKAANARRS